MSKFKAEFTLKQHTPIIHFQSEQIGATLRATELKPKFDRFLLDNVEGIAFVKNANGHKSLDYKVKMQQNSSKPQEINSRNPLFFGNMGDGDDKKFKLYENNFSIEFFSYDTKIVEAIESNFESFLAQTNFGTRQSKGFGSFYLVDETNNKPKAFDKKLIKHSVYSFESSNDKYQEDIKTFYSFLRAGINTVNREKETIFYIKAAIFAFAKSKGITWDKKAIKEKYLNNYLAKQQEKYPQKDNCVNYDSSNKRLMRDLFGLSSEQSWMSYKAKVSKESRTVDRFKSPITFKPIIENSKVMVYFWADDSVEKILNEEFLIRVNKKGDLKLKTPAVFSFDEFFEFTFSIELSKYVDSAFHNRTEYQKLSKILKDIKASL